MSQKYSFNINDWNAAEVELRAALTALLSGHPVGRLVIRELPHAWKEVDVIGGSLRKLEKEFGERKSTTEQSSISS